MNKEINKDRSFAGNLSTIPSSQVNRISDLETHVRSLTLRQTLFAFALMVQTITLLILAMR